MQDNALQGRRILITRPESTSLATALQEKHALPVLLPTVQLQKISQASSEAVLSTQHTMAIFASVPAVEFFFEDYSCPWLAEIPCLVAVGRKTAASLLSHGVVVHLVPTEERAAGLLAVLPEDLSAEKILLPRSAQGRPELVEGLRARGAQLTLLSLYETVALAPSTTPPPTADAICFASPSAVEGFFQKFHEFAAPFLSVCAVVAIGPTTATALQKHGVAVAQQAKTPSVEGLIEALEEVFRR